MEVMKSLINLFQRITRTKKVKALAEGKNTLVDSKVSFFEMNSVQGKQTNKNSFEILKKKDYSQKEKIRIILQTAGCEMGYFDQSIDLEKVNEDNLKNTISYLARLPFTKFQLGSVLSQNTDLLFESFDIIKKNEESLESYFEDLNDIKSMIYANPFILNIDLEYNLLQLKNLFTENGLDSKMIKYILIENAYLLTMDYDAVLKSLLMLKEQTSDLEKMKEKILDNPFMIGLTEEDILAIVQ